MRNRLDAGVAAYERICTGDSGRVPGGLLAKCQVDTCVLIANLQSQFFTCLFLRSTRPILSCNASQTRNQQLADVAALWCCLDTKEGASLHTPTPKPL
jgi:hypothetical protein